MLERAKERTAAEFGVVQAVLQAGSTVTTAECEGEPSPGAAPRYRRLQNRAWAFVLPSGMLCRVQFGWNRGV